MGQSGVVDLDVPLAHHFNCGDGVEMKAAMGVSGVEWSGVGWL